MRALLCFFLFRRALKETDLTAERHPESEGPQPCAANKSAPHYLIVISTFIGLVNSSEQPTLSD